MQLFCDCTLEVIQLSLTLAIALILWLKPVWVLYAYQTQPLFPGDGG